MLDTSRSREENLICPVLSMTVSCKAAQHVYIHKCIHGLKDKYILTRGKKPISKNISMKHTKNHKNLGLGFTCAVRFVHSISLPLSGHQCCCSAATCCVREDQVGGSPWNHSPSLPGWVTFPHPIQHPAVQTSVRTRARSSRAGTECS